MTPGAKKGSTAPYSRAELLLVEAGDRQPRTLANAFRNPIPLKSNRLFEDSVEALSSYLGKLDAAYATGEERRVLSLADAPVAGADPATLAGIAAWAKAAVEAGAA
jgi:CRISPR system Cascade subunit CasC